MTPEHWKRIEGLVEAALRHHGAHQSRFLDSACGHDQDLRCAVETLLESFAQVETFMETPALQSFDTATVARQEPAEPGGGTGTQGPDRVGPYRILRKIGHGGMGAVYLAAREDHEFERQVAIKLLQPEMSSGSVAQRFRSERQILANLDHRYIAKLLDGGTAEDGRPYLVMELIEGDRIDDYCDARRLSIRQRLELFLEVCAAVHYAHRNLVVHRDIKPSNILVSDEGVPKLLDFGIAKLLDPTDFPYPIEATRTGLRPMTPPYASPEQIRGEAITTASDVYSLGVLLYQLLTGRLPVAVAGLSPRELESALIQKRPARPSAALAQGATTGDPTPSPEEVGRRRGTQPHQLYRRLAGDLDNIVLMALRKEPERRYGSVEQLSDDLRRHLDGLPVSARRGAFAYRAGKFIRRHKVATAIAGSSLALVAGFAATMATQAVQLARQRDRARKERDKAKRVSAFLVDLFKLADPDEARGSDVTARELLDGSAENIRRELAGQPDVQASLLAAIGAIYRKLGLYDQAEPMLKEALSTRTEIFGGWHLEVSDSLYELAELDLDKGLYEEAGLLFRSALEIRRAALGPKHRSVAETTIHLADTYSRHGDRRRAEPLYRRGLRLLEARSGLDDSPLTARALAGVGDIHRRNGDFDRARTFQESALEIYQRVLPPDHPTVARNAIQLASIYSMSGGTDRAEPFYKSALASLERSLGKTHQATAVALNEYANHFSVQGEFERAEPIYRQAFDIFEKTLGEGHPDTVTSLLNLGSCSSRMGQFSLAESLYQRAIELAEDAVGQNRVLQAGSRFKLAIVYRRRGQYARAEPLFQRALALFEELGLEDANLAACLCHFGRLYHETGRYDRAEPLYERALKIRQRTYGPDHFYVTRVLIDLANMATQTGDYDYARKLYEGARGKLQELSRAHPENVQNQAGLAAVHYGLGDLFSLLGEEERARRAWKRALALSETVATRSELVDHRDVHCRTLLRLGWAEAAQPFAESLQAIGWSAPDFLSLCREHGLSPVS